MFLFLALTTPALLPCPTGPKDLEVLWASPSYDIGLRPPEFDHATSSLRGEAPDYGRLSSPTYVSVAPYPIKLGEFNTKLQKVTIEMDVRCRNEGCSVCVCYPCPPLPRRHRFTLRGTTRV